MPQVWPPESLGDVEPLGLREVSARDFEPADLIEADRIDHERIAFPMADGVSHPRGVEVLRVPATVEIDLPRGIKTAIDDQNQGARLDDPVFMKDTLQPDSGGEAPRLRRGILLAPITLLGDRVGPRQRLGPVADRHVIPFMPYTA